MLARLPMLEIANQPLSTPHRGYGTLDLPGVVDTRRNRFDGERTEPPAE